MLHTCFSRLDEAHVCTCGGTSQQPLSVCVAGWHEDGNAPAVVDVLGHPAEEVGIGVTPQANAVQVDDETLVPGQEQGIKRTHPQVRARPNVTSELEDDRVLDVLEIVATKHPYHPLRRHALPTR